MELYTYKLQNTSPTESGTFDIQDIIENYESLIWTERYYGDSEANLVCPIDIDLIKKLPLDTFIGIDDSNELLIIDTINVEDNRLKVRAISILTWLNNRFIRYAKEHKVQTKTFKNWQPGELLYQLLFDMVNPNSSILNTDSIGIASAYLNKLKIPEIGLFNFDSTGTPITVAVDYAPLFDEMTKIATANQVGMQIILQTKLNPSADKPLGFRSYRGLNKTRNQDPVLNPIVRFSQDLNTLENIRQIMSKSIYKTIAFAFGSSLTAELSTFAAASGVAFLDGTDDPDAFTGFNCRAIQVFDDNGPEVPPTSLDDAYFIALFDRLDSVAKNALEQAVLIEAVDGDIVQNNIYQYGRDYTLGDLVELQGMDGVYSIIRVTEHIISEDASGEKGYVTIGNPSGDVTV
jgi:hypothetical protein